MARRKDVTGRSRAGRRLFSLNAQTGVIAIRKGRGVKPGERPALERDNLLAVLKETEERLSPALAEDLVPAELAVAYLADGMYRELAEAEGAPSVELQSRLVEFILVAWDQGWFTPSPAFPYTFDEVVAAFQAVLEEEQDEEDTDYWVEPAQPSDQPSQQSAYARLKAGMRDIDAARDTFLRLGRQALQKKQFDRAEQHLRRSVEEDVLDESEATYYLGLTRLWQRDFHEAAFLFTADAEDREGEAPFSWLLAEWCALCAASDRSAYLAALRDEIDDPDEREDPLTYKEEVFAFDYGDFPDTVFQNHVAVLFASIRGDFEECLMILEETEQEGFLEEIPDWVAPFWQALARAGLGLLGEAREWVDLALTADIPPLLLLPLRWFKESQPEFYGQVVLPLFESCSLGPQIAEINEREQLVQQERISRLQWWMEQQNSGR